MNRHRDISDIVKGLLPVALIEKVREIENRLGKNIVFVEDVSLPGGAKGSANPEGIIRLSSASPLNVSVSGEEIMHLHRWTSGYPAIQPTHLAVIYEYARALLQLGGHFDEYAFFPFLEKLGLNPRAAIQAALQPQQEALRRVPMEELNTTKYRVGLSVV